MKKKLLSIALMGFAFVASSQTTIFKEDFNSYAAGSNLSSDLTGATAGQGGWFTKTENNGVNTASQIFSINTNDNGLQLTGYESGTTTPSSTRNIYHEFTSNWANRPTGQDFFNLEFIMNVEATTTSKNNFTSYVLDATGQVLIGVRFNYSTREIYGLFYDEITPSTNPKTYDVFPMSLGPLVNNLPTQLILSGVEQHFHVGLGFNVVTGEFYIAVQGITDPLLSGMAWTDSYGLPGKVPSVLKFSAIAGGTDNTLSANIIIDDIAVKAQSCTFPVSSEFNYDKSSACIGSGSFSPIVNLSTTTGVYSVTPSNGLTVDATTGIINSSGATAGIYSIKYVTTLDQALGQCSDFHTETFTIKNCAGIEENNSSSFSIFPNPTSDLVSISLGENNQNGTILLTSADGKVIETRNYSNASVQSFDVKGLTSGVYFFQVGNETQKVMIK
jgi:hypothetical protein